MLRDNLELPCLIEEGRVMMMMMLLLPMMMEIKNYKIGEEQDWAILAMKNPWYLLRFGIKIFMSRILKNKTKQME